MIDYFVFQVVFQIVILFLWAKKNSSKTTSDKNNKWKNGKPR